MTKSTTKIQLLTSTCRVSQVVGGKSGWRLIRLPCKNMYRMKLQIPNQNKELDWNLHRYDYDSIQRSLASGQRSILSSTARQHAAVSNSRCLAFQSSPLVHLMGSVASIDKDRVLITGHCD